MKRNGLPEMRKNHTAQLYGKTISGKTITEIKRKASRIANNYWNVKASSVVFLVLIEWK